MFYKFFKKDSKKLAYAPDDLIESEEMAVYADSAYMDKYRKQALEKRGVFCGIVERRVRGQSELTKNRNIIITWWLGFAR